LEEARPSVWPCVVALGVALALFGLATSLAFTAAGALVLALGVGGWIGDLRAEPRGVVLNELPAEGRGVPGVVAEEPAGGD
jgi:hypothetical protein